MEVVSRKAGSAFDVDAARDCFTVDMHVADHAARPVAQRAAGAAAQGVSPAAKPRSKPDGRKGRKPSRDQRGSHARRLVSNLRREPGAMRRLTAAGVTSETLAAVGAGLREAYVGSDGAAVAGVVVYPVADDRGRTRYGCLALDGYTVNAEHPVGWSMGAARSVSYGSGGIAIVCASALEAWLVSQAAADIGVQVTAIASSQADAAPEIWNARRFWAGWDRLLVSRGASRALVAAVKASAGRPVGLCDAAPTASSDAVVEADELAAWMTGVIRGRGEAACQSVPDDLLSMGDHAADRVSVHGGVHQGRMYYAFAVERRERTSAGSPIVYSYRTVVVRSDGALLDPIVLPAPPGTPADRRVHALSDGTRIDGVIALTTRSSWSLRGIERFAMRMQEGRDYDGPSGRELHAALVLHLRSSVWLPQAEDYGLIADFVMATYFHRCFEAFPILFITGPKGSGKSELTAAIAAVAFNGSLMSQGSGAALVRLARDTGGLIAVDDAEALTSGFGELGQVLKTGYKASTAIKRLVGPSGSSETIDFFGPRVLCNTRGLDDVLGSRCLAVATEPLPGGVGTIACSELDVGAWRDGMHEFAMDRVARMTELAGDLRATRQSREDELRLPLKAIAGLIGG